jgi:hypothetical protein
VPSFKKNMLRFEIPVDRCVLDALSLVTLQTRASVLSEWELLNSCVRVAGYAADGERLSHN